MMVSKFKIADSTNRLNSTFIWTFAASRNSIFKSGLRLLILGVLAVVPSNADGQTYTGVSARTQILLDHAAQLRCATDHMKDEIKTHFRRSRNYGKMLAANSRVKSRSAAIARRVKRDARYKKLGKDLQQLDEVVCQLNELFEDALIRAAKGIDKPILSDTHHVALKLYRMRDISQWMLASLNGAAVVYTRSPTPVVQPEYGVPVTRDYSELVAPGEIQVERSRPHSVLQR